MAPRFLLIEACDFSGFPVGGQLSVARSLISAFGTDLALVGWALPGERVGEWTTRRFKDCSVALFPFGYPEKKGGKPLVPRRISAYLQLRRYRKEIMSIGCGSAFMLAAETLLATSNWGFKSICYYLSGVNPIHSGRYGWTRFLCEKAVEPAYVAELPKADVLLAAADATAIAEFVRENDDALGNKQVIPWPTRVDMTVFKPTDLCEQRRLLHLPETGRVFVSSGRINQFKGWRLLLDSFALFLTRNPDALLVFVGDGEDRAKLQHHAFQLGISERVVVTGFLTAEKVSDHLNAADAFLVGSVYEGWSVAMVEALACGKPIVTTLVSGAAQMVRPGLNGYVVENRDPAAFARAMESVLALPDCSKDSRSLALPYNAATLRSDLEALWPAIS
jgi:glycosyltransferase involved in cell wall biosynthesis